MPSPKEEEEEVKMERQVIERDRVMETMKNREDQDVIGDTTFAVSGLFST